MIWFAGAVAAAWLAATLVEYLLALHAATSAARVPVPASRSRKRPLSPNQPRRRHDR